jgi:hypothetical protein
VVSRAPIDAAVLEKARFRKVAELPGNFVYENPKPQPRFFLVSRVRQVAGMPEAIAMIRSPDFNGRLEAVVEGDSGVGRWPARPAGESPAPPSSSIRVVRYEPLDVQLEINSDAPAYLVTSEVNYPGWRAFVDGRPRALFMTNIAFRGLTVPPGRHSITMRFQPTIFWQGAGVSLVSWAGLAALSLGDWISRRRSKLRLTSSA